ncbi:hypothetical protein [Synechococcus sp. CBW1108]|uniref:hypothetical protein n=1 Tax=Synechococcus sp. CBW1108 TaxID=1353147 RepID=UPI0018CFA503|nr:hypothetical protein [Synechococcus sp. CBW1108]QPN69363.1 hypothetical protein H8F27_12325 [Synechococcus sp. CBW1108]
MLQEAFGNAGTDPTAFRGNEATLAETLNSSGLQITVELRSAEELNGAAAAYAAQGHTGTERIYVNADWLASGPGAAEISQVLLEETGHAIDQRLNAELDSPGDEGELFAALLLGQSLSEGQLVRISVDADHQIMALDGVQVAVQTSEVAPDRIIISSDFESNPFNLGWTTEGEGASWTSSDAAAGIYSLRVEDNYWASPLIETTLNQWYNLSFKTKAP